MPKSALMDTTKLISCIKRRVSLWDRSDKAYHNRDVAKDLWNEVCTELGLDLSELETVRKRWNSLRDVFRREYTKTYRSPNGTTSSWYYFNPMSFLLPHMRPPREFTVEVVDPNECENYETCSFTMDQSQDEAAELKYSTELNMGQKRAAISDPFDNVIHESPPPKLIPPNSQSEEESDYHFLMSLLPFLRSVPAKKKMSVRMKIMQVLEAEADVQEPSTSSNSTSRPIDYEDA